MKRVSFKTLGCRLNQAETAAIAAGFESEGYRVVPVGEPCDACVVHTCTITARAEQKCLMYARSARKVNPGAIVVLAGCAVQVGGEALREKCGADLAVGQQDKYRIPELLRARTASSENAASVKAGSALDEPRAHTPSFATTRALVKVQDGCDFRCAYCIVPSARGRPTSRPLEEVTKEIRALAAEGFREITLTGANLACYQDDDNSLLDLICAVERIEDIERIRLSSIEVSTTERAIVDHMSASRKLCPFLHLPLQTGDDGLLRAMGRRYTSAEYRRFVEYATDRIPFLGLGTDILVGLPGEDDAAFENTFRLVQELPFGNLHVFPYSPRPGTRAASMSGQVPVAVKKERMERMSCLGAKKRDEFAHLFISRSVSVLIERVPQAGVGIGWTSERIEATVHRASVKVNDIVDFVPVACHSEVLC